MFSIVKHLASEIPDVSGRVVWMYDGVTLTGREKPLLTVEHIAGASELLAAGREDFAETYTFQVGIRARTATERERLSYAVAEALRERDITFYDTTGPEPVDTGQKFVVDVTDVTPMPADDIESDTDRHRTYIDAEVTIYRVNKDGLNFSQ